MSYILLYSYTLNINVSFISMYYNCVCVCVQGRWVEGGWVEVCGGCVLLWWRLTFKKYKFVNFFILFLLLLYVCAGRVVWRCVEGVCGALVAADI